MAGEPYITVVGNMAGDPELRFTSSGHAVANFTIAQTPREKDASGQFVDAETLWVRASVWREAAENVAETLTKGMRVIAHGRLKARSFETKDGQQRTNWELEVDEIGPSLRWATAQVNRSPRSGSSGFGAAPQSAPASSGWGNAPANDPWGGGAAATQGDTPPPF
ncbi:MAG TPA: single-stranded DNA-binding protein [Enteractinococcus sp.]